MQVDMYMYMYSDLPHVHGADRRGVRGCAATVLRPGLLSFTSGMYMGVGAGVGTLVMPECMRNASIESVLEKSWIFCHFFVRTLYYVRKCKNQRLHF